MRTDDAVSVDDELGLELTRGLELESGIPIKGHLLLELRGPDGELKSVVEVDNLITTVGRNEIVDNLLASPAAGKPTHQAVGTGATAAAVGDTALGAESARVALTSKTRAGNVLTLVGDFAAGVATAALTEAGVFVGTGAVSMWSRAVYSVQNKGANDTLKLTWTYTIG